MEKNIFSEIFQHYLVFIPAKNIINILKELLGQITTNLIECAKIIENITKSDSNFAPTFADYQVISDIIFFTYLRNISSMLKKFKHRFYIKELLNWICKDN